MKSVFLKLQSKKRIFVGATVAVLALSAGIGGYAFAVTSGVTTTITSSDAKTITAVVPYTAIVNAPSDGHGGYLLDLSDFPANARVTSVDMLVGTPFTTNEGSTMTGTLNLVDPSDTLSSVPYLIMDDLSEGPSGSNHTNFWVTQRPGVAEQTTGGILPDTGVLQLDVDRWGGALDPGEAITAGDVTVYANYIQY